MLHQLFGFGAVPPDPRWHMAAHSHSFHEMIAVTEGRLLLSFGTDSLVAKAGDILFYHSGFVHEEKSDSKRPFRSLFFSFAMKDSLSWLPVLTHDTDGRVLQLMKWITEDERERRPADMRGIFLEAMLGELRRLCHSPANPWLKDVLAFIHENLAHPLTLDDLADQGNMSKFAFVRKFKRLSGRTPMEEVRLIRLNQARTLLLTTNLPVKAIAPAVGIGDESQLSKLFRLHFKLSPRDLRT